MSKVFPIFEVSKQKDMKKLSLTKGQVKEIANMIQTEFRIHSEGNSYVVYDVTTGLTSLQTTKVLMAFEKAVSKLVMKKARMMESETIKFHEGFKDYMDFAMMNRIFLSKVNKAVITLLSGHNFG